MEYGAAKFWLEVFAIGANGLVWLYVWRVRRDMATNAKITEIETSIGEHVADNGVQLAHIDERLRCAVGVPELEPLHKRMNSMDKQISGAVAHADLEPLHRRMNNMDKQLGEIRGKMHTLDLIHELLLNRSKE